MAGLNRYGLSRDIPDGIKREVRQRCGFGCVCCGAAVFQYEHFNPEFTDARSHSASGITLLCGACHDRKTRGLLSTDTVASADSSPFCKRSGFSFGPFDFGTSRAPEVAIGALVCRNVRSLIRIEGVDLLSVKKPESPGAPFLLSANLYDSHGCELIRIVENEWQSRSDNWDVEVVGPRITFRGGPGKIALVLRSEPPNRLVVERLDLFFQGYSIKGSEHEQFDLITPNGRSVLSSGMELDGCAIGIEVSNEQLCIGVGGGSVYLKYVEFNGSAFPAPQARQVLNTIPRVGRNEPCPCGSGKKYKRCHGIVT